MLTKIVGMYFICMSVVSKASLEFHTLPTRIMLESKEESNPLRTMVKTSIAIKSDFIQNMLACQMHGEEDPCVKIFLSKYRVRDWIRIMNQIVSIEKCSPSTHEQMLQMSHRIKNKFGNNIEKIFSLAVEGEYLGVALVIKACMYLYISQLRYNEKKSLYFPGMQHLAKIHIAEKHKKYRQHLGIMKELHRYYYYFYRVKLDKGLTFEMSLHELLAFNILDYGVNKGSFRLDLSGWNLSSINKLHEVSVAAFNCLEEIQNINLENNYITHIPSGFFKRYHYPNLEEIDLSYNKIAKIESGAFQHIPNLRCIKLIGNPVCHDGITIPRLKKEFPQVEIIDTEA